MSHHEPEEKIKICELICTNYSSGDKTLSSCIENQSISVKTFHEWRTESKQIAETFEKAKAKVKEFRRKALKVAALNSLQKLIEGFNADELHQEVEPIYDDQGKEIGTKTIKLKRVNKYYAPNASAVMFALKALEPTTYRDALPMATSEKQTYIIGGKQIEF